MTIPPPPGKNWTRKILGLLKFPMATLKDSINFTRNPIIFYATLQLIWCPSSEKHLSGLGPSVLYSLWLAYKPLSRISARTQSLLLLTAHARPKANCALRSLIFKCIIQMSKILRAQEKIQDGRRNEIVVY